MIDVLKMAGTSYEMGVQQGRQYRYLNGDIDFFKVLSNMGMITAASPVGGGAVLDFALKKMMSGNSKKMVKSIKNHLPTQYDYLVGLAEGLGVSLETLALPLYFENMSGDCRMDMKKGKGVPEIKPLATPFGCSAGLVVKKDKGFLVKNFDFPTELEEYQVVRFLRPSDKKRFNSITATIGVLPGAISGINEKGLAMTVNAAYTNEFKLTNPPTSMYLQECLETMTTADEVKLYLSEVPMSAGWFITVIDSKLKGYIIERTAISTGVRDLEVEGNRGCLTVANNYQTKRMIKKQLPDNTVWNVKGIKGEPVIFLSQWRKDRLEQLLTDLTKGRGALNVASLRKIMADHKHTPSAPWDESVCRHSEFYKTLSTVYMNPVEKKFAINDGNACSKNKTMEFSMDFKYDVPDIKLLRKNSGPYKFFKKLD